VAAVAERLDRLDAADDLAGDERLAHRDDAGDFDGLFQRNRLGTRLDVVVGPINPVGDAKEFHRSEALASRLAQAREKLDRARRAPLFHRRHRCVEVRHARIAQTPELLVQRGLVAEHCHVGGAGHALAV